MTISMKEPFLDSRLYCCVLIDFDLQSNESKHVGTQSCFESK
jgi:hypothetical protein